MKAVKVDDIGTEHDGYPPTKVTSGSPDVFIDGKPAARVGDPLEPHDKPNSPKHGRVIATGSSTVFINGRPAALTGGAVSCGGVTIGTGTVNIGDQPPASQASSASPRHTTAIPQGMVKKTVNATAGTAVFTPKEILVPVPEEQVVVDPLTEENLIEAAAGTPAEETERQKFKITDIPGVMRNIKNWPKSAELMELWFSLPAKEMIKDEKKGKIRADLYPPEYTNTTMFTWHWLEQFSQVLEARNKLINTLLTKNAKKEFSYCITNYFKSKPHLETTTHIINALNPVQLHSHWQFQRSHVGYGSSMDELYGSLGNFALYAAITKATITKTTNHHLTPNNYSVHITEVGLYMRDTYEFIGEQYVGHWAFEGLTLEPVAGALNKADIEYSLPCWSFETGGLVEGFGNADYRQYRKETGLGGDLLLFSDVKTIPVDIKFDVKAP